MRRIHIVNEKILITDIVAILSVPEERVRFDPPPNRYRVKPKKVVLEKLRSVVVLRSGRKIHTRMGPEGLGELIKREDQPMAEYKTHDSECRTFKCIKTKWVCRNCGPLDVNEFYPYDKSRCRECRNKHNAEYRKMAQNK